MNNLPVRLKQHTPLIHFQHDQEGATLRATEVKAKLDRFIKEELKSIDPIFYQEHEDLIANYFPKNKLLNSPYKLKVIPIGSPKKFTIKTSFSSNDSTPNHERITGSFFGDELKMRGVIYESGLDLYIFSFIPGMAKFIEKALPFLFVMSNFGCRQSKGFGSFSVDGGIYDINWAKEVWSKSKKCQKLLAVYQINNELAAYQEKLMQIHRDYQVLKSGNNHGGYQKSKLFEYMLPVRWEKRKIKQFIVKNQSRFQKNLYAKKHQDSTPEDMTKFSLNDPSGANYDYRFVRALLGLAEQHEYLIERRHNGEIKADTKEKYIVQFAHKPVSEEEEDKIERYSSPIQFKIYRNQTFALISPISAKIFNQPFEIKLTLKSRPNQAAILPGGLLTPTRTSFDLVQFLDTKFKAYKKII